ncbi:MAG: GspH/FimT family pseudopilin [Pseudohongiellaceae bacterium]
MTLIEALIVIAVMAVLIYVALPGLGAFVDNQRVSSDTNDLFTSLLLARGEAVTRNSAVSLCKIDPDSPTDCANTRPWQSGWIAFVDQDSDGDRDAGDTILETYTGMGSNTVVTAAGFANFVSYRPSGSTNTGGSYTVCVNSSVARNIIINATGRPRIAETVCP